MHLVSRAYIERAVQSYNRRQLQIQKHAQPQQWGAFLFMVMVAAIIMIASLKYIYGM